MNNLKKLYANTSNINIHITTGCNLRCSYCFNSLTEETRQLEEFDISDKTLTLLSKFINSCEKENIRISFFGGEPLLRWDNCKKIQEYLKNNCNKRIGYTIVTNATLLNESILDDMINCRKECESDMIINLSIDGNQLEHDKYRVFSSGKGSWDNVLKTVELLRSKKQEFDIISTTDTEIDLAKNTIGLFEMDAKRIRTFIPRCTSEVTNFDFDVTRLTNEFINIVEYLLENPSKVYLNFGRFSLDDPKAVKKNYEYFKNRIPLFRCYLFDGRVYLHANGDFTSCSAMYTKDDVWGNLYTMETEGISNKYNLFDTFSMKQCLDCEYRAGCRRCIHQSVQKTGSFFACDKDTKEYAKVMSSIIDYYFKRARQKGFLKEG